MKYQVNVNEIYLWWPQRCWAVPFEFYDGKHVTTPGYCFDVDPTCNSFMFFDEWASKIFMPIDSVYFIEVATGKRVEFTTFGTINETVQINQHVPEGPGWRCVSYSMKDLKICCDCCYAEEDDE